MFILFFALIILIPNQILSCDINCQICSTNNVCTQCIPNYFIDPQSKICITTQYCLSNQQTACLPCPYNRCFRNGDPLICPPSYYLLMIKQGLICKTCKTSNCVECINNGICNACYSGFYLDVNNNCQICINNCQVCSDSNICIKCRLGYILNIDNSSCIIFNYYPSFYLDKNFNLQPCLSTCYICNYHHNNCTQCIDGYYLNNTNCLSCPPICSTCINQKLCTSCNQGVLQNYQCVGSCLDSEYFDPMMRSCKSCDESCFGCLIDGITCTSCKDPILYEFNSTSGRCRLRCNMNMYMVAKNGNSYVNYNYMDGFDTCKSCPNFCLSCINNSYCLKCDTRYHNLNGICNISCNVNYYTLRINSFNYCIQCDKYCQNCINQSKCIQCKEGFISDNNGSCLFNNTPICNHMLMNQFCLLICPISTISQGNKCICDISCNICVYNPNSLLVSCLKCNNSLNYEWNGICYSKCPSNAPYFISNYQINDYTINKCVPSCFGNYKLNNNRCTLRCQSYQYQLQKVCINITQTSFFINYEKLYISLPYTISCISNCVRCDNPYSCLQCNSSYVLQLNKNQYICALSCNSSYINKSQYCQPCRINCNQCSYGLVFNQYLNRSCTPQCSPNYIYNNRTNGCEPQNQLILQIFGHYVTYNNQNQYSYLREMRIRITNTSDCGQLTQYSLSSNSSDPIISTFSMVKTPLYTQIILNGSILKPNRHYSFFVQCYPILNSTNFFTVPIPTAKISLSPNIYTPIVTTLNLNISNLTCSNVTNFNISLFMKSDIDTELQIFYTQITSLDMFYINFSIPLSKQIEWINLIANIYSQYSEFNQTFNLRINQKQLIGGKNDLSKMQYFLNQLNYVNAKNLSIITLSIQQSITVKYSENYQAPCTSCRFGTCINKVCNCFAFYTGANCDYPTSLFAVIQQIQTKLFSLINLRTNRLLISEVFISYQLLLQIIYTISYFPDAITWKMFPDLINYLNLIDQFDYIQDIEKYIQTLSNLNQAYNIIGLNNKYISFIQSSLIYAINQLKFHLFSLNSYTFNSNGIYFTIKSSEVYLSTLMTQEVPYLTLSTNQWLVGFFYNRFAYNPYIKPCFAYAIRLFCYNQTFLYYSSGANQSILYNATIYNTKSKKCLAKSMVVQISSNLSCSVMSQEWIGLQKDQVKKQNQSAQVYMIFYYHAGLFLIIVVVCLISEYRSCNAVGTDRKKVHVINERSIVGISERNSNKQIDQKYVVGNEQKDKSLNFKNIAIQKQMQIQGISHNSQINSELDQVQNNSQFKKQIKIQQPKLQNQENHFTYFLIKKSFSFPYYIWFLILMLEYLLYYSMAAALYQQSIVNKFFISFCILGGTAYNILLYIPNQMIKSIKIRFPHLVLIFMILLVLFLLSAWEFFLSLSDQGINILIGIGISLAHWLIIDNLLYLYCRYRNEQKHMLAGLIRRYMRWKRMIKFLNEYESRYGN